jgi:hypothetical protein
MPPLDRDNICGRFDEVVNMAPAALEEWLESEQSRRVGFTRPGEDESVGHASGRRIVGLLRKRKAELDDDDLAHMRKVVGFVRRHSARRPENMVTSRWRYSLMNWGHDPLKEGK